MEGQSRSSDDDSSADCLDPDLGLSIQQELGRYHADGQGQVDLLSVHHLSVGDGDLKGIECLKNLKTLFFRFQDDEPLSSTETAQLALLEKLSALYVVGAPDLSFLSALPQLTAVESAEGIVSDLTPLMGLAKLDFLYLARLSHLASLEPLGTLESLTYLYLEDVNVGDTMTWDSSFLNELALEFLGVYHVRTNLDAGALDTSRLRSLSVGDATISGLSGLGPPGQGRGRLNLDANRFSDPTFDPEELCDKGWCVYRREDYASPSALLCETCER